MHRQSADRVRTDAHTVLTDRQSHKHADAHQKQPDHERLRQKIACTYWLQVLTVSIKRVTKLGASVKTSRTYHALRDQLRVRKHLRYNYTWFTLAWNMLQEIPVCTAVASFTMFKACNLSAKEVFFDLCAKQIVSRRGLKFSLFHCYFLPFDESAVSRTCVLVLMLWPGPNARRFARPLCPEVHEVSGKTTMLAENGL